MSFSRNEWEKTVAKRNLNENSGSYKNWRVSSSVYSDVEGVDMSRAILVEEEESSRNSTEVGLVGCLPCAPSPSKAAFAMGGAMGGAAKKCAGNLISCKKPNYSSAVSPKKTSSSSQLPPKDTSFYALSSENEWCCGVVPASVKKANKKL